jgi:ferrous iron transport protein B
MRDSTSVAARLRTVALIGNPNSGKTTVFNALTGLRQKIGNYPGVTVERKEGRLSLDDGSVVTVLDLPGTYSLSASSPDERIATDVLLGKTGYSSQPDVVVCVVDASNLERNLLLVSQVIDQELPLIVALNMIDVADDAGIRINHRLLASELGVPVIPMTASKGVGFDDLRKALAEPPTRSPKARQWPLPEPVLREWEELAEMLASVHHMERAEAFHEAMDLLSRPEVTELDTVRFSPEILHHLKKAHQKLSFLGFDRHRMAIEGRYAWINPLVAHVVSRTPKPGDPISDRIDRVVTHHVWGFIIFFTLMATMFQAIFSWAETPMNLIAALFDGLGHWIISTMRPGDLRDLLVNGALAGVSAVVTFLPQILFLFLFLGLLEDTGYMARAAFVMDRYMRKVGLHGKSFIPLLSSFACAIPGIMATRTIERSRDRLATIMVAPLMSCSARLPVYALLIAAAIPAHRVFGILSLRAFTLLSMYFLGLGAAFGISWIFKTTLLRGAPTAFIMEMPPYRLPSLKSVVLQMWERAWVFLKRAGTIILGASIILWFLATYPRMDGGTPSEKLQHSFAGRAGHAIEPVLAPLGFDWKIGIGLISSLLQREMFVSTLGTIYNVESTDEAGKVSLAQHMQNDTDSVTGHREFTPLTGLCLMVYYVFAMQCLSTVAVVHRETNSWRWPLFQIAYMTALAYGATYFVARVGTVLGIGG